MSHLVNLLQSGLVRHRTAVVIALVAALVSSGTAAAVSYLVLGTTNTAGATTTLKSGVNGAVVQLSNTNTTGGTSARGLAITVPAGRAPISVNATAGKATYLNADKLDGLDSTQFARGSHTTVLSKRLVIGSADVFVPMLDIPQLGSLIVLCSDVFPEDARVLFENTSGEAVRVLGDWRQPGANYRAVTLPPGGGDEAQYEISFWDTTAGGTGMTAEIGAGSGSANRSASIQARAYRPFDGSGCEFQATAILWSAQ